MFSSRICGDGDYLAGIGPIKSAPRVIAVSLAVLTGCASGPGDVVSDAVPTTARPTSSSPTTAPHVTATDPPDASPTTTSPPPTSPPDTAPVQPTQPAALELVTFDVPPGSRPHDVAPAGDGGVWYTAQASGELGWLDPETGDTRHIPLGPRSRPHGVIVGPDGAAWVTDGGLNAIVRVDPTTNEVTIFELPADSPEANLNTAAFDSAGRLWFTGQNGIHGWLDPTDGEMEIFDSPRGPGPYGITATPAGEVYFVSLAGNYLGRVDRDGAVTVIEPPTPQQGARRVWSDSTGAVWVSEWNSGQLSRFEPRTSAWTEWALPGPDPQAYAVYVDDTDAVWMSDFGGNALHRFDPVEEAFDTFELPFEPANVRQILGRPGEVWAGASAADALFVIRAAD